MITSGLVNVFTNDIQAALFWVDDVDAAFDAVTAVGAPTVTTPQDAGNNNRNAVVRDPDGTIVELVAKRS